MTWAWLPGDLTSSNKVTQSPGFQIWLEPQFSQKSEGKVFLLPGYQPHLKLSLIEILEAWLGLNINK